MLISEKQHAANCRNALLSTGPVTAEGKGAVRLNALRHGLRARTIVLPGENAAEFQQLCDDLQAEWRPASRTEHLLVEQMAVAQWKLARLEVGERSIFTQQMPAERQMALLDRFSTQRSRLERSFSKAMHELRDLRKARPATKEQPLAKQQNAAPRASSPEPGSAGALPPAPPYVMAPRAT
jgi:hypothetical protein